jgi:hypothetical protein
MDNMYDVFVLIINYYDDLIIYVDDYVDDVTVKNENDEVMMNNDLYLSEKENYLTRWKKIKNIETAIIENTISICH